MKMINITRQRVHWDTVTRRRSPYHPIIHSFASGKIRWILDRLPHKDNATILEVGAGNGYFSVELARYFDVTCIDYSANMLRLHPFASTHKVQGDVLSLPFPSDSFDFVFSANLLHHVPEPLIALREMGRVSRSHVIAIEPNAMNPLNFLYGIVNSNERGGSEIFPQVSQICGRRGRARIGCEHCSRDHPPKQDTEVSRATAELL